MKHGTLLFGVATFVFASASAYLWSEVREARAQNSTLQARVQELERTRVARSPFQRPQQPEPRPAEIAVEPAAPAPSARPTATWAVLPEQKPNAEPSDANRRDRQAMAMERQRRLMEDPEYRAAMRMQQKMGILRMYSDLGQALQLQPAETEKLLDLLAEQQLQQMEGRPAGLNNGAPDPAAMQEWQQKLAQQRAQNERDIAALVGDAKAAELQNYQKTLGARNQVRELSTMLANSAAPLRNEQMQPLIDAIATEQQRRSTEFRPARPADRASALEDNIKRLEQYNQRMHDAAASHLSSQQLERFDAILNQQLEMQRASMRMMRAQAEAEARGDIPSAATVNANGVVTAVGPALSGISGR
jgi:hypothetical protein